MSFDRPQATTASSFPKVSAMMPARTNKYRINTFRHQDLRPIISFGVLVAPGQPVYEPCLLRRITRITP